MKRTCHEDDFRGGDIKTYELNKVKSAKRKDCPKKQSLGMEFHWDITNNHLINTVIFG
jgi:hypothetical protein